MSASVRPTSTAGGPIEVSVVICTHNGAYRIAEMLRPLLAQRTTRRWELILADNASTDGVGDVVRAQWQSAVPLKVVREPVKGQSRTRNTAIAAARGQAVLFTDDDVRVGETWVEDMARPLLDDGAAAVVGRIVIPPSRTPPWLTGDWPSYFCSTGHYSDPAPELVGACMGFHRRVLDAVPGFDPELGPGRLGFFDDTLFAYQLVKAGFRLRFLDRVVVEHYFDLDRLERPRLVQFAAAHGRSRAYFDYHWRHRSAGLAWRYRLSWRRVFWTRRLRQKLLGGSEAVPDMTEMIQRMEIAYWDAMRGYRGQPRLYALQGLSLLRTAE